MTEEYLILRPDVVATVFDDGAVLLDLESKFFYTVNASGWGIVQMLESGASRQQVAAQCRAWGDADTGAEAVNAFLDCFEQEGLVMREAGVAAMSENRLDTSWTAPAVEKHREPLQRLITSAFDPSLPLAE